MLLAQVSLLPSLRRWNAQRQQEASAAVTAFDRRRADRRQQLAVRTAAGTATETAASWLQSRAGPSAAAGQHLGARPRSPDQLELFRCGGAAVPSPPGPAAVPAARSPPGPAAVLFCFRPSLHPAPPMQGDGRHRPARRLRGEHALGGEHRRRGAPVSALRPAPCAARPVWRVPCALPAPRALHPAPSASAQARRQWRLECCRTELTPPPAETAAPCRGDVLVVSGDVSDELAVLERALGALAAKFGHVFYTPGAHDSDGCCRNGCCLYESCWPFMLAPALPLREGERWRSPGPAPHSAAAGNHELWVRERDRCGRWVLRRRCLTQFSPQAGASRSSSRDKPPAGCLPAPGCFMFCREAGIFDSLTKLQRIQQLCQRLGVHTRPRRLGSTWIVPLLRRGPGGVAGSGPCRCGSDVPGRPAARMRSEDL